MFIELTLYHDYSTKYYNTQYIKSLRQETYATVLDLTYGTELVVERAEEIYRMIQEGESNEIRKTE